MTCNTLQNGLQPRYPYKPILMSIYWQLILIFSSVRESTEKNGVHPKKAPEAESKK